MHQKKQKLEMERNNCFFQCNTVYFSIMCSWSCPVCA